MDRQVTDLTDLRGRASADASPLPPGQDPAREVRAALRRTHPVVPDLAGWSRDLGAELDSRVHVLDARLCPLAGPAPQDDALPTWLSVGLPPAAAHDPMFRTVMTSGSEQVRVRSIVAGGKVQAVLLVSGRPLDAARLERLDRAAAQLADHFNRSRPPPAPHELLMLQAGIRLLAGHALRSSVWSKVVEEFRLPQAGPYAMLVLTGVPAPLLAAALVTHGELEWRDLMPATIDLAGVALLRSRLLETLETVPGGDVLLETLRTWVREEYRNDRTSAALGVHRHTLNNRLRRCERLLGARLDAPDTSFGLWLLFHDGADTGSARP